MKVLAAGLAASLANVGTLCTLVKFTLSTGRIIALADHDADVTLGGIVYASSFAFEVSSISIHSGTESSSLEFSTLLDPAVFDRDDILSGRLDRAQCEVFVCDYANPGNGAGLYYAGRVQQISFAGDVTAVLQINSLLDQNVLLGYEHFSYTCTADLGDARCKVNIAGLSKTFTVALAALPGQGLETSLTDVDAYWNGGVIEFNTGLNEGYAIEIGQYLAAAGAIVTKLPFPYALAAGDEGTIYPGCDKTPDTCLNTYSNIANYRGVPIGVDPLSGSPLTTLSGAIALPADQQPPGTVGVYDTLDGSFGWFSPSQLPALHSAAEVPPGVTPDPATIAGTNGVLPWKRATSRQFPLYIATFGTPAYNSASNLIEVLFTIQATNVESEATFFATDSATAYGAKFNFNGYIYVYTDNNLPIPGN